MADVKFQALKNANVDTNTQINEAGMLSFTESDIYLGTGNNKIKYTKEPLTIEGDADSLLKSASNQDIQYYPKDFVIPNIGKLRSLSNGNFNYRQNGNNTWIESDINYTWYTSNNASTQIANTIIIDDVDTYKGLIVELKMTYSNIPGYIQNGNYKFFGIGGNNYGIFQYIPNSNRLTADQNPQKQYYVNTYDLVYARYIDVSGTSKMIIDCIRGNNIINNSHLVFTTPNNATRLLGFSHCWTQGSAYEKLISPSNVIAVNLVAIKTGHSLLKETLDTNDIQQLKALYNEALSIRRN